MSGDDGRPAGGLSTQLLLSAGELLPLVTADGSARRRAAGSGEFCLEPACTGPGGGSVTRFRSLGRDARRWSGEDAARGAGTGDPRRWPGEDDARGAGTGEPRRWSGEDDARGAGMGMKRWTLQGCPESRCRSTCHGSWVQAPPSSHVAVAIWPRSTSGGSIDAAGIAAISGSSSSSCHSSSSPSSEQASACQASPAGLIASAAPALMLPAPSDEKDSVLCPGQGEQGSALCVDVAVGARRSERSAITESDRPDSPRAGTRPSAMAAGDPLVGEWKCRWMSGISWGSSGMCTWALTMDPGEEAEAYGAEAEAGTERGELVGVARSPPA